MILYLDHVGNLYFLASECGTIYKTWLESEFTQRKLNNAVKKIQARHPEGKPIEVKEMIRE